MMRNLAVLLATSTILTVAQEATTTQAPDYQALLSSLRANSPRISLLKDVQSLSGVAGAAFTAPARLKKIQPASTNPAFVSASASLVSQLLSANTNFVPSRIVSSSLEE